jgi:hypothetical protein
MAIAAIIWAKKTRLLRYFRKLIKKFNLSKDIKNIKVFGLKKNDNFVP